ncbi:MAG: PIN domain-containing protein [Deltaproteobacteria bacterium]|nr:PIN domain-containing protein [Deltaproteobacteria bacterium]
MYLIDTSAWIDFLKKRSDRLVPYLESREACLTDIVLFELLSGMPVEHQLSLRRDLALFRRLPLTEEVAVAAAAVAATMRHKGMPPQTTDMLIAGIALGYEATLIHRDTDFEQIKRFCALKTLSFLE